MAATITNGYVFQAFVSVRLCYGYACRDVAEAVHALRLSDVLSLLGTVRPSSWLRGFGHYLAGCGMQDEPKCFDEYCGLKIFFAREEKKIEMAEEGDTSESEEENGDEQLGLKLLNAQRILGTSGACTLTSLRPGESPARQRLPSDVL